MKTSGHSKTIVSLKEKESNLDEIYSLEQDIKANIVNSDNLALKDVTISSIQEKYYDKKNFKSPASILTYHLIMSTDELALILDTKANSRAKNSNSLPYQPFIIEHKNINKFIDHLNQLLETNQPFHYDFIIRNDTDNSHSAAVQTSYDGVNTKLFSSDASVNDSNYSEIAKIAKVLQYGKENRFIPKYHLIQDHMAGRRQKASYGCVMFSLCDLNIMAKRAKTGLQADILSENNILKSTYNSIKFMLNGKLPLNYSMNYVDPKFHKLTQHETNLNNFLKNNPRKNSIINKAGQTLEEFKKESRIAYSGLNIDLAFNKFARKYIKASLARAQELFEKGGELALDEAISRRKNWNNNNTALSIPILSLLQDRDGNYREDEETWLKLKELLDKSPLSRKTAVQESLNFITSSEICEGLINLLPEEERHQMVIKQHAFEFDKTIELMFGNSSTGGINSRSFLSNNNASGKGNNRW